MANSINLGSLFLNCEKINGCEKTIAIKTIKRQSLSKKLVAEVHSNAFPNE